MGSICGGVRGEWGVFVAHAFLLLFFLRCLLGVIIHLARPPASAAHDWSGDVLSMLTFFLESWI